jgi:hypothetical protein
LPELAHSFNAIAHHWYPELNTSFGASAAHILSQFMHKAGGRPRTPPPHVDYFILLLIRWEFMFMYPACSSRIEVPWFTAPLSTTPMRNHQTLEAGTFSSSRYLGVVISVNKYPEIVSQSEHVTACCIHICANCLACRVDILFQWSCLLTSS